MVHLPLLEHLARISHFIWLPNSYEWIEFFKSNSIYQRWLIFFSCVTGQEPLTLSFEYLISCLFLTPTLKSDNRLVLWGLCAIVHHFFSHWKSLFSSFKDCSVITFPRNLSVTLYPHLAKLDQASLFSAPTATCPYMPPSCSYHGAEMMYLPVCLPH